jgi:transcriptional regulator with XRE-family HTH domain
VARKIEELRKTMTPQQREQSKELSREMLLSDIRKAAGRTQSEVAEALGVDQSVISKLEQQNNMKIDTLQRIIAEYGGTLQIVAQLPSGDVTLSQFTTQ